MARLFQQTTWQEYGARRKSDRARLFHAAEHGDKQAQAVFKNVARQIKTEANKRLRGLERHKYDYGSAYNNLVYYLQTELHSNRVLSYTALRKNYSDLYYMTEQALKFLKNDFSDWKNMEANEMWKFENIRKKQLSGENKLTKDTRAFIGKSYKQAKEFLKFLGNESISASIEATGQSDVLVEAMYDQYEKYGKDIFSVMELAFGEFNAGRITFDVAMKRTGIKIEDYLFKTRTT